mgnify:CR=1 FL=1
MSERKNVDLPQPDGPIIAITSPFFTVVLIFSSTTSGGGALTLTVATYQTTKGECYHKVGITPDEIVEPGEDAIDYDNPDPEKDPQLKKAIEMVTQ